MYRSCSVCGRIHPEDKMCKRVYKKNTKESQFRNTNAWIKKRNLIKKRDKYLCQLCLKDNVYNYDDLQVHHIIPIVKNYNKMLYRKLVYTGITRSKKKLYIIGDISALDIAVANTSVDIRRTTIKDFLINGIK